MVCLNDEECLVVVVDVAHVKLLFFGWSSGYNVNQSHNQNLNF